MPRPTNNTSNDMLLQAALEGLYLQRERLEEQILEVKRSLSHRGTPERGSRGKRTPAKAAARGNAGAKRELSPDARKRIAAAQKRRWAEYRKKLSAAGKEA